MRQGRDDKEGENKESSIFSSSLSFSNIFSDNEEKIRTLENESEKIIKDKTLTRSFLEKQHNRVSAIEELAHLPKPNQQIRIITQKQFNAYAILLYILESHQIEECYLTTYNIDDNTIKGLELITKAKQITKLTLLVSASISFRMPKRYQQLVDLATTNPNITLILAWNHTKIILAKTKDNYFVNEGSGNLTNNARVEQYLLENCKDTYEFHKEWIESVRNWNYKGNQVIE